MTTPANSTRTTPVSGIKLRNALMSITGYAHCGAEDLCMGSGSKRDGVRLMTYCALLRDNADLVTAAPNLLDACQWLVAQVESKWPDHDWQTDTSAWGKPMRAALAAILRATGERG